MAEDTVSGGTASVEIEGILVLNEESVKAAEERLAQITGSDVSTPEGRSAGKGKKAAAAKDVQQAAGRDVYKLTIDGAHLRAQIMAALEAPFKIVIDADVRGALRAAGVGAEHTETLARGAAPQRAEPDDRLKGSISKFGKTIDDLHDTLSSATTRLGQTFGRGTTPLEKMADILEHFGAVDFKDLIELQKTAGHPKVVGGRASATALTASGFTEQEAGDVENFLRAMTSGGGQNLKQSEAMALVSRVRQWMGTPGPAAGRPDPMSDPSSPEYQRALRQHEDRGTGSAANVGGETYDRSWLQREIAKLVQLGTDEYSAAKQAYFSGYAPEKMRVFHEAGRDPDAAEAELISYRRALAAMGPEPMATEAAATPALDAIRAADETLKQSLAKIPFQAVTPEDLIAKYPIDRELRRGGIATAVGEVPARTGAPGTTGRRVRRAQAATPDLDPEATERANAQLGDRERANVNRLIGGMPKRVINGIDVTEGMASLLRAARGEGAQQGEFHGLIQGVKTGKVARFVPGTEEEAARARAREEQGRNGRPFTLEGFGEQARVVNPTEAFWAEVTKVYGDEITQQLRSDPEVKNLVSQSLRAGAARRPLVNPQPPQPGQGGGERGGIVSASAQGFEKGYQAAYRLLETLDDIQEVSADIEGLWARIEERQGSGKPTERLEATVRKREDRLSILEARAKDLARTAEDIGDPRLRRLAGAAGITTALGGPYPTLAPEMRAAREARQARIAEESGGRYRNLGQAIVGEQVGLTEEEKAKRAVQSLQGYAAKELGFDEALADLGDAIVGKFKDPAFGRPDENSAQIMGRAFRETVAPFLTGLPEKGRERRLGEQAVSDLRRGLFGEKEKVIQGAGSQAFTTTERRGGLLRITNEEAERAANLMESGRGRGRVARIAREVPTGLSSNSGGVETAPDFLRPATALDQEKQVLLGRGQRAAEARAAQEKQARQDAAREAGRRFPKVRATTQDGDEVFTGPSADVAGYKQFFARSLASRMGKIPAADDQSARLAEIERIQRQADTVLSQIAGGNPLGLPYGPELPGTSQRIPSFRRNRPGSSIEAERLAAAALSTGEVRSEALDVLKTRTAGSARLPYARDTGDIPAGDETSRRFRERGGMVAGEGGEQAAYRYQGKMAWQAEGLAASGGTMHVIIAGQTAPVTVALAGEGGGAGGGGGGRRRPPRGRDEQPNEEPIGPMYGPPVPPGLFGGPQPNRTLFAAREAFDTQYGRRDPLGTRKRPAMRVKRTAQEIGLERLAREQAAAEKEAARLADEPFARASANARAEEAAQRRAAAAQRQADAQLARDRRMARVNDPVGFAKQRDIADTSLADIRGQNRAIQRRVPRRGFGASLTDLVTSVIGGGALEAQLEAADRAQREVTEINQAAEKRSGFITQRRGVLQQARELPQGNARRLGLLEQAAELRQAAEAQTEIIKESTNVFQQNSKVVKDNTAKAFAAAGVGGAVSAAAGSVQFALASVITAPLLTATGEVISASLEKIFGQPTAIGQARLGLGEAVRAAGGRADVGLATIATQTGLAAENQRRVGPLLEQTGAIEAGNKALQEQINLFRLVQDQQRRGGGAAGVTQTLGGQFGTALGGTTPAAELISDFLREGIPSQPIGGFRGAPGRGFVVPGQAEGTPLTPEKLALMAQKLDLVNAQLDKNGESLINFADASRFTTEETQAQARALKEVSPQLAALVAEGRVAITNQQGGLATADEVAKGLTTALEQQAKPSARALLEQQRPQIEAQIALEDMQRRFQIETVNPQTFAIAEAARPLGPAAAGIDTTGLTKEQAAGVNAELAQTQKLYDQINQETEAGVAAAKEFVATTFNYDPKVGQQFADSLDHVAEIGKQITSIEIGLQTKQAAFSAAQFSYQIDLAKRSLSDAKGLVSGVGDSLGAVERRIYDLNRQSQALSLGQSQRQINFQTALANFQAPGLSSEEAEARIAQAKTEAEFAQKQLNIQKQLFGLSGRGFNIQARRQVQDLNRQIDLLERGRVLSVETAAAEKKIIALTKIAAKENRQVETFYNTAVTRTGEINAKIVELVAASQEAMSDVGNIVLRQFRNTYQGMITIISGGNESNAEIAAGGGADRHNAMGWLGMGDYTHAEGWMGTVNGATSFGKYGVAGEAGGEAVAILRDPKMLASPSGGGGGDTFVVNIYNPVVKSDDDKRRLIADVKRALQSEASMLLPRRA